jgi:pSer/pThr/pTyr-binding forkhead associated (FHA) protein
MVTTPDPWASLLIFQPSTPTYTIQLTSPSTSIGRDPRCDIVVDMSGISKKHVVITLVDGTYPFIQDSSTNGTIINGRLVNGKTVPLAHRAEFHIKWDFYVVFLRSGQKETQVSYWGSDEVDSRRDLLCI